MDYSLLFGIENNKHKLLARQLGTLRDHSANLEASNRISANIVSKRS
jgi:hypothetical protein